MPHDSTPARRAGLTHVPWAAAVVSACLLTLVAFDGRARSPIDDTDAYHRRVHEASLAALPYRIGDWTGTDAPTPPSAVAMLKPNVLVNRRYRNLRTGEVATVLLVQCPDARDLLGHYPPVCYPSNGLAAGPFAARTWNVAGLRIRATRYRFIDSRLSSSSELVVDNFMVLPTGRTGPDMESVSQVAKDRRWRNFGAAEIQVVTDGSMGEEARDAAFRALVEPLVPFLTVLQPEAQRD